MFKTNKRIKKNLNVILRIALILSISICVFGCAEYEDESATNINREIPKEQYIETKTEEPIDVPIVIPKIKPFSFVLNEEEIIVGDEINLEYISNLESDENEILQNEESTNDEVVFEEDEKDDIEVTFSFDNEELISIEEEKAYAISEGILTVTLFYEDEECDKKTFTINPILVEEISADNIELFIDDEVEPVISYNPENCTHLNYLLISSDEEIAQIVDNKIVGIGEGITTITIESIDGPNSTFEVNVKPILVENIIVEDIEMTIGEELELDVSFEPENCTHKEFTIKSNDESIIEIVENKIKAVGDGKTTLLIESFDGVSKKINAKVDPINPESISIKGSSEVEVNKTINLVANIMPANTTHKEVTWVSSDKKVLTVDENGVVTGKKGGSATVTAKTINGLSASKEIKVVYPQVSSISIDNGGYTSLQVTHTLQLKIKYNPEKVSDDSITWSSSNKKVATIDEKGLVTGVSVGTVTITAISVNNKKATFELTVVKKAEKKAISQVKPEPEGYGEVWIPKSGKKYHSKSNCSNMKNPSKVSEEEAINRGYTKCSKCW